MRHQIQNHVPNPSPSFSCFPSRPHRRSHHLHLLSRQLGKCRFFQMPCPRHHPTFPSSQRSPSRQRLLVLQRQIWPNLALSRLLRPRTVAQIASSRKCASTIESVQRKPKRRRRRRRREQGPIWRKGQLPVHCRSSHQPSFQTQDWYDCSTLRVLVHAIFLSRCSRLPFSRQLRRRHCHLSRRRKRQRPLALSRHQLHHRLKSRGQRRI